MFWRVASFSHASPLDLLLQKADFSVEDLLDCEDVVKEVRANNVKLIAQLKKKATLAKLLGFIVDSVPADADPRHTFKYPYTACEIITSEVDEIQVPLAEDPELLARLFAILQQPAPLNAMRAAYFARIITSLLARRSREVMDFLQAHPGLLSAAVQHVGTLAVAEVLVWLLGANEHSAAFLPAQQLAWLGGTRTVQELLAVLEQGEPGDTCTNACKVLESLARASGSPLHQVLSERELLRGMLGHALAAQHSTMLPEVLNICIALLDHKATPADLHRLSASGSIPAEALEAAEAAREAGVVEGIAAHAAALGRLLAGWGPPERTQWGAAPRFGLARLTAVMLIGVLVKTGQAAAEEAVMGAGLVKQCLALVADFPFNSVLHAQVTALVVIALEGGSDRLLAHLLDECELLTWLVEMPTKVSPTPAPNDTRKRAPLRAGYIGHLDMIANKLLQVAPDRPVVEAALAAHPAWPAFAAGPLAQRNELSNLSCWLCGRPEPPPFPNGGADADDMRCVDEAVPMDGCYSPPREHRYSSAFDDDELDEPDGGGIGALNGHHSSYYFPDRSADEDDGDGGDGPTFKRLQGRGGEDAEGHHRADDTSEMLHSHSPWSPTRRHDPEEDHWESVPDSWEDALLDDDQDGGSASSAVLCGIDDDILVVTSDAEADDAVIVDALEALHIITGAAQRAASPPSPPAAAASAAASPSGPPVTAMEAVVLGGPTPGDDEAADGRNRAQLSPREEPPADVDRECGADAHEPPAGEEGQERSAGESRGEGSGQGMDVEDGPVGGVAAGMEDEGEGDGLPHAARRFLDMEPARRASAGLEKLAGGSEPESPEPTEADGKDLSPEFSTFQYWRTSLPVQIDAEDT